MRKIELLKAGKYGLEGRLLKANTFQHHTGYQINIFPFKTQPGGHVFKNDFLSFQGIMGEVIRLSNNTELDKFKNTANYKTELKQTILKNVLEKVETSEKKQLEDIINKMFFEHDNSLFKYDFHVISYKNFINNNNAIKDVPVFISDVFIQNNEQFKALFSENKSKNILNQLISECLPNHIDKKDSKRDKQIFKNMIPAVTEIFQKDFDFLMSDKDYFLENFELFFKYYYFFYFTQLTFKLDNFGQQDYHIKPIYFSMDWENLSESRLQLHKIGWREVSKHYERVFAHANALELINYILVDNTLIGDYDEITKLFNSFEESEKEEFKTCLEQLLEFYKNEVKTLNPPASWEECHSNLNLKSFDQEITTLIYSLWYTIRYQFENGKRNKPYKDYALWLSSFSKENFTKSGGRLGSKLVLSQEILLFLTKLCVGNREKIRLKSFWEKLQERGITFDETSKLEVIKLFERINLIEKKSDSGDAQYIKSSL
ncbi:DNA phosphorothioation-dependent restriction protein DptG [Chryseobacterium sp. JV274]|uniref:DNA phosphorothioation-dependent restriction protein DptG n=1 Tax=Chryseobacterium sp. JV274 TaxID=1932669 RepID=UPI0015C2130F|nr:DNA phosphorothioation-dependent restriction protein DptG [Chryseobacterium sp. JV274]CAD0224635.1 DNA phosphorothioation-dependent restriction protein DptG [Chryseobacterium sp. JV274]